MREVSDMMQVKAPTDEEISAILAELDEDNDGQLDRDEFVNIITMVFEKMLDNEEDLIHMIRCRDETHTHQKFDDK